jgi:tetratricopeptide (TPR) repeat protein
MASQIKRAQSLNRSITLSICLITLCLLNPYNQRALSQTITDVNINDRELGQKLYREHKYSEAAAVFKKATKRDKTDADSWYYLGLISLQQNDFKNATKAFETAVKLRPNSAAAHTGLAYAFLLRNKLKEGLTEAERAIALDANSADAHYVYAAANLRLGARDKALRGAERAIELNKGFSNAYLVKSQALVQFSGDVIVQGIAASREEQTNRYREAATALETYLQLTPSSSDSKLWQEQLEALKFHVATRSSANREQYDIYTGRDVTTKARLISKPEPRYTEEARRNQTTGTVILRVVFAADGKVKHIVVIQVLPDGLTWRSIDAAKKIKFIPATLNGRPVSMFIQLEYNFNLY